MLQLVAATGRCRTFQPEVGREVTSWSYSCLRSTRITRNMLKCHFATNEAVLLVYEATMRASVPATLLSGSIAMRSFVPVTEFVALLQYCKEST